MTEFFDQFLSNLKDTSVLEYVAVIAGNILATYALRE